MYNRIHTLSRLGKAHAGIVVAVTKVYLSLGSNIGDRAANLNAAIAELPGAGVSVSKVSSFYETEPVDYLQQDWFLNCVVEGETDLRAQNLLTRLREIETRLGSKKVIAKGPRILDIDILLYGDETIATAELQVPHPRMTQRRFVLVPLAEIAPDLRHPSWNASAKELLAATADHSEVRRFDPAI
jgi:2-amino-4-hydroxy-6-hydroxymethyldihydropteridine diphosphokinase